MKKKIRFIDFSLRLPDTNRMEQIPSYLEDYGRCAVLRSGNFWFGGFRSSHPGNTAAGFYWAVGEETLYFSARGSSCCWENQISGDFIRFVMTKAQLKPIKEDRNENIY